MWFVSRRGDTSLAAVLRHLLLQRLSLSVRILHDIVCTID
jgi:hypothetical protein